MTTTAKLLKDRALASRTPRKRTIGELALYLGKVDATNCGADEAIAALALGRLGIPSPTNDQIGLLADVLEAYALLLQKSDIEVGEELPCRTNAPF